MKRLTISLVLVLTGGLAFLWMSRSALHEPGLHNISRDYPGNNPGNSSGDGTRYGTGSRRDILAKVAGPAVEHRAEVEAHEQVTPTSPRDLHSLFKNMKILSQLKLPANENGISRELTIYQTDFRNSRIRVVEEFLKKPNENSPKLVGRSTMMADHILVRLKPNATDDDFQQLLQEEQAEIVEMNLNSNLITVSFDGTDPEAMARVLKNFRENPSVEQADPDYLVALQPNTVQYGTTMLK